MRTTNLFIAVVILALSLGCKKETPLGPAAELKPDYVIPQGQSPADNRIVDLHQRYGTYFLYNFTTADFRWNQVIKRTAAIQATPGDPAFVGQALDLLDQVWLKFYPEAFLKEKMPYKVFLSATINSTPTVLTQAHAGTDNIAVGYVNSSLATANAAFKLTYKNKINEVFIEHLLSKGSLELPSTFFDVSNYNVNVVSTTTDANYFKTRGFVKTTTSSLASTATERSQANDIKDFLMTIVITNNATWNSTMNTFPLIKRKYDILTEFMMTRYGIDLKEIANATY